MSPPSGGDAVTMVQKEALNQKVGVNRGGDGVGAAWGENEGNKQPCQFAGTHPLIPQMLASVGHQFIPLLLSE